MTDVLKTPIEYLGGVGPRKAALLKSELNIHVFEDLLFHLPFRYIDKSKTYKLSDLHNVEASIQTEGTIVSIEEKGAHRKKRLIAIVKDGTARGELVWFKGINFIKKQIKPGDRIRIFGKPTTFNFKPQFAHPEIEHWHGKKEELRLTPVYHSTERLNAISLHSKGIVKLQLALHHQIKGHIQETLPDYIISQMKLVSKEKAIFEAHFPENQSQASNAKNRLKFEELLLIQLLLFNRKLKQTKKLKSYIFDKIGPNFTNFYDNHLPFELTGAQKRVLKEVRRDVKSGAHMNRLIQGDVGSGKTIVAFLSMLIAIDSGYQAAMMAPTEILAIQHFEGISELVKGLPIQVRLLTGSTKTKERRILHQEIETGLVQILIGTHALIEDKVKFVNLGLAIIDEQHRFGVKQRAKLWLKNELPPHSLVMTATPIPRTLAMTVYGDLDISVIDELPPGRKEIKTLHRTDSHRLQVFKFIEDEVRLGRQVYVVYPLIEESETLDYKDLFDGYNSMLRRFPRPEYQISMVHGKMKPEDKEFEMNQFINGKTQIMVATTVIEVGVNVPNASVMIIESVERFGLSQLHQLRGRVGRGAEQSYCVLMSGLKLSAEAKKRISTMVETTDGFKIAEVDLEIRGPGDVMGTQQSGVMDLKVANIVEDQQILVFARDLARKIYDKDPDLNHSANEKLNISLNKLMKERPNWGRIG